ncbi:MAG: endonuclease/exonuclease/phosphatase family protein [Betaproteobacteria bacterium]|nr:endonuclease/exonuclease/phosphatase family protein [Betaproteobacteria bacterium]
MKLITWNIQWCRGVDGNVDPARIIGHARDFADFDVLCLQEVARNYPGLEGNQVRDQFQALADLLPGFVAIEGIAVDEFSARDGRRQFGNMILSRVPVGQVFRHLLPWPADPWVPTMPRVALEVVLATAAGPLRVTTSHLEFYSAVQREAQVERLRALQAEACGHAADAWQEEKRGGPFETRQRGPAGILTGDFNYEVSDPIHARLQQPDAPGLPRYIDAWTIANPGIPHAPTVGVYDKVQWHGREFCCDFICVSEDVAPRVRAVAVDPRTAASDHQPVLLELDG